MPYDEAQANEYGQVDVDDDLPLGQADGPETLPAPRSSEDAEKQEPIWEYHRAVLYGRKIRFIPRSIVLAPQAGEPKRRLVSTDRVLQTLAKIKEIL